MKARNHVIHLFLGLAVVVFLMFCRGFTAVHTAADRVLIIGDSFTIAAFLYLGTGSLIWVSATGCFDIFGYALKRCVRVLIPGWGNTAAETYCEYKVKRRERRRPFSQHSTVLTGFFLLVCSLVFTAVWYLM